MADSSGTTLILPPVNTGPSKPASDRKSKKGTLMQIQSDTISAAKAALNPVRANILPQKQKQRKKKLLVCYMNLSFQEGKTPLHLLLT